MPSQKSADLYDLLKRTAETHPDREAVVCHDFHCNYRRLKERVDRLAQSLNSLGIQKDDKLAIIHKNCHRYLEAYFAVAKLGAILVPINYRLAEQDFIYILNDAKAKALIAKPELIRGLKKRMNDIPTLEKIILTSQEKGVTWEETSDYDSFFEGTAPIEEAAAPVTDFTTAQIYYTSGTTGRPKGVILTHQNNLTHAEWAIKELRLTKNDRWIHVSPMFHLADAWAVWSITQTAGTHVIFPCFEPAVVLETIAKHRVTLSNFIPTMLNILVNFKDIEDYDLSSLRLIMSGGAPIAKEVVRKVIHLFGCDYIQTYGLTETSPFLTMSILKKEMKNLPFEERLKVMVTTGRPFFDVQIKVVREGGDEVDPDNQEVGEIIAKGETITPGYWNLPEETSMRIVEGWLHTRDLAVVNPEGYVTIVDRKDDVILTGGENVYSIEVEDALYSHPGILEAAVIGLPDPVWGEKVTAIVVPKEGENLTETEVIQFCKDNMAPFKAPKRVIFTENLPKTGSAKIYKYKLREKYRSEER
ncbi:long-chain-fatty-acid--CoA ligase [Acidobacteriota bacterium]